MFSSISLSISSNSRRTATLCSVAVHAAAVAALWAASQAITAPAMPRYEPQGTMLVVSPPPRLFRPRPRLKTTVQRFEVERAASTSAPEAIRAEPQAPKVEARTDPSPMLPSEPEIAVRSPAARPAGFAQVARAVAPKLKWEPQADRFGTAIGKLAPTSVVLPGGPPGFGAAGLAKAPSPAATAGDSGFRKVEIERAARRAGPAGAAGFGAAESRPAIETSGEPPTPITRNRPVKILWKPVPKYSEEGLRLRIEGDVVLLVRFLAQGRVETLEIVSGLGHGLDEYALQAAESIRFEPATQGDQPVDFTARIRIRFELAH